MCGIAGAVVWDGGARADATVARAMAAALRHRGPDGTSTCTLEAALGDAGAPARVALAHTRLAVIDTSAAARQPFVSEDGGVHLVFNGEIYNHRALRRGLEARGHRFVSRCDAEVVLHLYEERGADVAGALRGMYAFAIVDVARGRLVLARDPAGEKPLFLAPVTGGLAFASEPAALLAGAAAGGPAVERVLDRAAVDLYLTLGFIPAPRTALRGVEKLLPGETRVLERGRWRAARTPRFGVRGGPCEPSRHLPVGVRARVRAAVREAVTARLESDVPLGGFLSGGTDSAIVCALARRQLGALPTFTIGFEDAAWDERPHAAEAARALGTDHHALLLDDGALSALPEIILRHGEPFADESALAVHRLAAWARERVTVALTGDGGDELFLGYRRQRLLGPLGLVDALIPAPVRRMLARFAPAPRGTRGITDQLLRLAESLGDDAVGRYVRWLSVFPTAAGERQARGVIAQAGGPRAFDLGVYLPDDLLAKCDRSTMAHGLEARAPLCDPRVAALAAELPARRKAPAPWQGKRLLLDAFRDLLPRAVHRRPKMGFGVPVGAWLRREPWRARTLSLLGPDGFAARGLVQAPRVEALLREHFEQGHERGRSLYALLALELFCRQLLDPPTPTPVPW
jgi:asparagine synthase (glutamine-hydrolysing)